MFAVTGARSTIIEEVRNIRGGEEIVRIETQFFEINRQFMRVVNCDRYVLAAGILYGKRMRDLSYNAMCETFAVNCLSPMQICETALEENDRARICIVGSLSASRGSFDQVYAVSKAAIHAYVLNRSLKSAQQLFAVAPTVIRDSGMTRSRKDYPGVIEGRRTVTARQVADVIVRHLWDESESPLRNAILPVE